MARINSNQGPHGVELSLSWRPARDGQIPHNAVPAGNGIFVGRAMFNGELVPGKVSQGHNSCYIPWGGKEHSISEYEVLCDSSTRCFGQGYEWRRTSLDNVPRGALIAGQANGHPYFVGRANVQGECCVGKVYLPNKTAYFPYGGIEHNLSEYEVLVFKNH